MPPIHLTLATPVTDLPDVGPKRAAALHRLDIHTTADLLKHLPHRWEYHTGQTPIGQLQPDTLATAIGEIANCRYIPPAGRSRKGRFQATLEDDTGTLDLVFFNAAYLKDKLSPGMRIAVSGKLTTFRDYLQMTNPKWHRIDEDDATHTPSPDASYQPIYPATEDLSAEAIARIITPLLAPLLPQIEDHLPDDYRTARALPPLTDAYKVLHQPTHPDDVKAARRRLAFDELLLLQLGLTMKRHHTRAHFASPTLEHNPAIDRHIRDRFPFPLTPAQDKVVKDITLDLTTPAPTNRLIQGDVGSGKTVVALYAMLLASASRKQAALMAPTELLAEQHHASISAMLTGSNVHITLLTGSMPAPDRAQALADIASGKTDLVIGTHALLSAGVDYHDLAVVIIDEQHRFGVTQRAALRSKSAEPNTIPHTLVMTATPIPRTLSLTLFGDLDISTIDTLPPGRQPIDTRVVSDTQHDDVYTYLAGRVDAGEQLYVVLPAIEDSSTGLRTVNSHAKLLEQKWFAGKRVATVHGQLKPKTRAQIMDRFRRGDIDVLVATTVIEVGVDVPNASLMVVEHAERFGLAQLHQLRGRVGRGTQRSLCVFVADTQTTEDADLRLKAIADSTNGFDIAEADLHIRGMGELIGARQAGLPPFRIANLETDLELLRLAKTDAEQFITQDPLLNEPQHALLRARLFKQYQDALGLGDVA